MQHCGSATTNWLRCAAAPANCFIARAVVARPANFNAPSGINGFERALLLPEMAVPATPATLILPPGWYQQGRFIELFGEQKQVAKLLNVIEKGSDFDRCTVSLV